MARSEHPQPITCKATQGMSMPIVLGSLLKAAFCRSALFNFADAKDVLVDGLGVPVVPRPRLWRAQGPGLPAAHG